jgi:hypothetical protein
MNANRQSGACDAADLASRATTNGAKFMPTAGGHLLVSIDWDWTVSFRKRQR